MRIEQIDVKHATPEQYAAINEFGNVIRTERMPDDPPMPLDEEIRLADAESSRDRDWMSKAAPGLVKACEWVIRERQAILCSRRPRSNLPRPPSRPTARRRCTPTPSWPNATA